MERSAACTPDRCAHGNFCCPNGCKDTLELDEPTAATSLPWRCRCTEPAPDRIGVVRVRRPGDESSCPRCGSTQAEYEAELAEGFDPWGA